MPPQVHAASGAEVLPALTRLRGGRGSHSGRSEIANEPKGRGWLRLLVWTAAGASLAVGLSVLWLEEFSLRSARAKRDYAGINRAMDRLAWLGRDDSAARIQVAKRAGSAGDWPAAFDALRGALALSPEHAGGLRVVATPWAHVRVDGELVETTPFARAIPLSAGKHFVTLTHPDAESKVEREITIVAGETMMLDVTLNVEDAGKDAH